MNNRKRVCTASVVGGGIAITIMIGIISALFHLAGWIGDRYRARHPGEMNITARRNCWLRADPNHMARLATEIEYGPDFLIAHFSDGAVRDLREHARDSRPCPWKLSGREALVRLSFDTAETATAFLLLILELGGELAPQAHLPASATGDLVP